MFNKKLLKSGFISIGIASLLGFSPVFLSAVPVSAQVNGLTENEQYSTEGDIPIIGFGSTGDPVENVQYFLKQEGYFDGLVDGVFGRQTQAAVLNFQAEHDLDPDGLVGRNTLQVMARLNDGPILGNERDYNRNSQQEGVNNLNEYDEEEGFLEEDQGAYENEGF
ncbi:MAG: peptidoglycan-binding domain-containing protein [Halothece sp.]